MTQSTLRAVTLKTVANYTHAAERAVGAYRAGGHRLISAMQRGVDKAAKQGAERLAPRLAAALHRANTRVSGLAVKSLDAVSTRTERAIEFGSSGVTTQLKRVADLVEGVDSRVVASSVQAAVRISMPGAQAALALSERVAAGAGKLPGASSRVKAAKPAKRMVRSRVAAEVEAPVKAVAQRAAAGVKKVRKAGAPVIAEVAVAVKPKAARKPAAKPAGVAAQAGRAARAKVKAVSEAAESVVEAAAA
jgi:hypothetical protein